MKPLFVNSAWPQSWGGGEKWTVDAAEWFHAHGHDVHVVGRPHSRLIAAARERELACTETIFGGDWDPLAVWRARRILRSTGAEIAIVNFNKEAWQFGFACKLLGIPLVARHGFPLFKRNSSHRFLTRQCLTRLVVNAVSIRNGYVSLGIDVTNAAIIHNGVRMVPQNSGELRRRFGIECNDLLLVAAGRLEPQKRFDRLIEIAAHLAVQHSNLRVLIAGEGPLRSELEKQIANRSLQNHIQLTGFLPDLSRVVGDADVFVLTSDDEGTPNALLEAMAAGVACVSFDVGAVPEVFGSEFHNDMISLGKVEAMTARIHALLGDADTRRRTANTMQGRVRSQFSLDDSMRQFERLFLETLKPSE